MGIQFQWGQWVWVCGRADTVADDGGGDVQVVVKGRGHGAEGIVYRAWSIEQSVEGRNYAPPVKLLSSLGGGREGVNSLKLFSSLG